MDLKLGVGGNQLMLKNYMDLLVEKILLFILLKIASQQIIRQMAFIQIISRVELPFGIIIGHLIIKQILIWQKGVKHGNLIPKEKWSIFVEQEKFFILIFDMYIIKNLKLIVICMGLKEIFFGKYPRWK